VTVQLTREQVRKDLRVYMNRTGMDLHQIADETGFTHRTLIQFVSEAQYGTGDGSLTAAALKSFMDVHPWEPPDLPGHLYETAATREMDELLAYCRKGRWGTLYGPAGSQKSFWGEYRAAEAARGAEPGLLWIPIAGRTTAAAMLRKISMAVGAPYAQASDAIRQNIIYTVKKRRTPVALLLDEMDLLEKDIDTLETLRRLGDLLRGKLGLIVAGNEQIIYLFKERQGRYFEQWRSRIEQRELRVLGPTREEARGMAMAELGEATEAQVNGLLDDCTVKAPLSGKKYISARRLFFAIENIRDLREKRRAN
jgi:type II secretory pathway predicted ATPase ExeA